MFRLTPFKELSKRTGLYKQARAFMRTVKRKPLKEFRKDISFYSKLITPGALCFDVGANFGHHTEALLSAGARVIAFEPQPDLYRDLAALCKNYGRRLQTCEAALGAEIGQSIIYLRENSGQSGLLQDWEGQIKETLVVPVITLDKAIEQYGIPEFIKIDVEGYELEVLKGLTHKIPQLSLEYHLRDREIDTLLSCLTYLSRFGNLLLNISPADNLVFAWEDWVSFSVFKTRFPINFVHNDEFRFGDIFVRIV